MDDIDMLYEQIGDLSKQVRGEKMILRKILMNVLHRVKHLPIGNIAAEFNVSQVTVKKTLKEYDTFPEELHEKI